MNQGAVEGEELGVFPAPQEAEGVGAVEEAAKDKLALATSGLVWPFCSKNRLQSNEIPSLGWQLSRIWHCDCFESCLCCTLRPLGPDVGALHGEAGASSLEWPPQVGFWRPKAAYEGRGLAWSFGGYCLQDRIGSHRGLI